MIMKRMYYFTDVLPFLTWGEAAINKLERSLAVFKESAESIQLVWHPWSGTEKYLELNKSEVKDRYVEIIKQYVDEGWGELDSSCSIQDAKEVLHSCDAYYGDVCDLIYEAQNAKMPIMIQSIDV